LISETEIQKQSSPIETGQVINRTAEFSAFKLLLTGVDDSAIQPAKRSKTEGLTRAAKVEVIDELISSHRERLSEYVGEDDSDMELHSQLSRLNETLTRERELLQETEKTHQGILEHRNELRRRIETAKDRRGEIRELLERFRLLDQHYSSDLERLEGIREAGTLVAALSPQTCPLCGAAPMAQHVRDECDGNVEIVIAATDAEKTKISRLRSELRVTTDTLVAEAAAFDTDLPSLEQELVKAARAFEHTSPSVSDRRAAYSEVVEKRSAVQSALALLGSISELETRRGAVSADSAKPEEMSEDFVDLSTSTLYEFSTVLEQILKDWNFPDASGVYFDKVARDFVIAGKPRGSRGKGLRAITHAAFNIALLEYAFKTQRPHPGFVVLDTPLLAYREPDGEEDDLSGTDVQERFYQYLAANTDRQIVILENVDPPADIKARDLTTIFSRNPHHGRFGFFPLPDQ
jgi:hypothetical protein